MAGSVNKVILIGNIGKDPEVKSFANGGRIANFSIATSESWRDKTSGERKEKTEWHNIVVDNDNIIKVVEQYCKKGSKIYVEGQLTTRKWQDRDGNDRYTTEVRIGRFKGELTLLEGRDAGNTPGRTHGGFGDDGNDFSDPRPMRQAPAAPKKPAYDALDDDVPF